MANSFVKWCRTKLLNGYKHMHVVNVEEGGGRSDTETLVRACEEELLLTSCSSTPTPGAHYHTHPNPAYLTSGHTTTCNTSTTRLSPGSQRGRTFASQGRTWQATFTNNNTINNNNNNTHMTPTYVEEVSCDVSVAAGEADRQEFSFTLYDFDGHGKVTKDDISGLVRTIYDAVGSSLSLPPSGSRTIRVKLTVAPENKTNKDDSQSQTGLQPEERDKQHRCCGGDDVEEDFHRSHRRRRTRRRSTSLQRHELLQIIQANMEKNNLYYTPLNRHHDHTRHDGHSQRRRKKHNGGCGCAHNSTGSPPDPAQVKARLMESDCPCHHTHYHTHTHPVTNTTNNNCKRHYRSRSHDLTNDSPHVFRYHLLDKTFQPLPPSNTPDQPPSPPNPNISHKFHGHQHSHLRHQHHHHHRSHSFDGGDTKNSSPRGRRPYRRSNSHQSSQHTPQQGRKSEVLIEMSPHHNKHRHREADHARAMSQVVAWLERGSLLDSSLNSSNAGGSCDTSTGGQNHHVHQHIHHHYHHYNETKPISPVGDQQTLDVPHLLI
ncbi:unnamed protein product [Meganyctiphanes norvegica]|uniref:Protein naked cuticle homolog n=1 Tax=Meganyctiphanes norvegica TaxID=48144 RepID=A0AAV2QZS5_MEGNR